MHILAVCWGVMTLAVPAVVAVTVEVSILVFRKIYCRGLYISVPEDLSALNDMVHWMQIGNLRSLHIRMPPELSQATQFDP